MPLPLDELAEALTTHLLKNHLTRNEALAHKLLRDFSPNLEQYFEKRLLEQTHALKVDLHKTTVQHKETLAELARASAQLAKVRQLLDNFMELELRVRWGIKNLLDPQTPELRTIVKELEETDTGHITWPAFVETKGI